MKVLLSLIKKEFYHIIRDKRSLLILVGMPIVQVVLFGFAISNEIHEAPIAVVAPNKSQTVLRLLERIEVSSYFHIVRFLESGGQLDEVFKEGEIKLVLLIDKDFSRDLGQRKTAKLQVIADATDPNTATTLTGYIEAITNRFAREGFSPLPVGKQMPPLIDINVKMQYNPSLRSVFLFVPGIITVILLLISAMMISITLAREKEKGNMEILLVSPLNPVVIVLGKVLPYVILALVNGWSILLLGVWLFGVPIRGDLVLIFGEMLLFVLTALSLGLFISTKVQTQQAALMISLIGLMLPTIILSGFIFPIESMPLPLQFISHLIPAKWFLIILRAIMLKGATLHYVVKETIILGIICLVLLGLAVKNFKTRLE